MDLSPLTYTIGIKRKFLPFCKKFKVVAHAVDASASPARLVLTQTSGSLIMIPEINHKQWKVFPDYHPATANQKKLKEEQNAKAGV